MKNITLLLCTVFLLVSCSKNKSGGAGYDDVRDVQRPANISIYDGPVDVFDGDLPENVAGTQEALVAEVGDRVFFAYDSDSLTANSKKTLSRQVKWLEMNPKVSVVIEGHADERGTREYNLALGERRAEAVKRFLVSSGIADSRVSTISYGKERPVDPSSDEASWSINRRAVTTVSE